MNNDLKSIQNLVKSFCFNFRCLNIFQDFRYALKTLVWERFFGVKMLKHRPSTTIYRTYQANNKERKRRPRNPQDFFPHGRRSPPMPCRLTPLELTPTTLTPLKTTPTEQYEKKNPFEFPTAQSLCQSFEAASKDLGSGKNAGYLLKRGFYAGNKLQMNSDYESDLQLQYPSPEILQLQYPSPEIQVFSFCSSPDPGCHDDEQFLKSSPDGSDQPVIISHIKLDTFPDEMTKSESQLPLAANHKHSLNLEQLQISETYIKSKSLCEESQLLTEPAKMPAVRSLGNSCEVLKIKPDVVTGTEFLNPPTRTESQENNTLKIKTTDILQTEFTSEESDYKSEDLAEENASLLNCSPIVDPPYRDPNGCLASYSDDP